MKFFATKILICLVLAALVLFPTVGLAQVTGDCDVNDKYCSVGGSNFFVPRFFGTGGAAGTTSFGELTVMIFNTILMVAGSVAILFLIIGGFRYIPSRGNEEATEAAKKTMTAALVGLIVVFMSFAMVFIISQVLITGSTGVGDGT